MCRMEEMANTLTPSGGLFELVIDELSPQALHVLKEASASSSSRARRQANLKNKQGRDFYRN